MVGSAGHKTSGIYLLVSILSRYVGSWSSNPRTLGMSQIITEADTSTAARVYDRSSDAMYADNYSYRRQKIHVLGVTGDERLPSGLVWTFCNVK